MPFPDLSPEAVAGYRSPATAPEDFDAFWAATLAEGRSHDLGLVRHLHEAGPVFRIEDIRFAGYGGHEVRAWLIAPPGATSVVVKYIGYGGGRSFAHEHLFWPATGRAVLVMDTRGQGSTWAMGETPDPQGSDPAHPGFMTRGIRRREDYYYRRVFSDAVRAVEAARALGFNRIAVTGGSQGGGIALAVAGLMPGLSGVMPDVPYLCDFWRGVTVATRDPYLEIARYLAVHRGAEAAVFHTLSYFDGVNFAARATAPALFSVGLMDTVCPPSTVYGAFNAYGGPKDMARYVFNDHEGGGPFQEMRQKDWLAGVMPA
ncbi:acetylxylan esterase [Rhodobacter sp. KR11]|uniref:acetylxylan esterase n=1 Tax=Rhodobacter sp. KR11 TaxID=2974588 RepID=UPI00222311EB|nr:acetylxylan esterase [Rhodobacter sp. KR11]MCW1920596.1 acetylxylan esterase [Rhodobacter sp. KR11]